MAKKTEFDINFGLHFDNPFKRKPDPAPRPPFHRTGPPMPPPNPHKKQHQSHGIFQNLFLNVGQSNGPLIYKGFGQYLEGDEPVYCGYGRYVTEK